MSSGEAIQELLDSPELPKAVERLSTMLESEKKRREQFYDEITPSMKAEFINGEVIVQSPVSLNHLNATKNLMLLLDSFVRRRALGEVFPEKALIVLTRNDCEPDICFFSKEKAGQFHGEQSKFPAPDMVVEVLSPSTEGRDRGIKFRDYAAHGVREYWIVNVDAQVVEQYRLEGDAYRLVVKSNSGDVASAVVEGLRIPIRAVFDGEMALRVVQEILH